ERKRDARELRKKRERERDRSLSYRERELWKERKRRRRWWFTAAPASPNCRQTQVPRHCLAAHVVLRYSWSIVGQLLLQNEKAVYKSSGWDLISLTSNTGITRINYNETVHHGHNEN
ncbi:hypothetical protein M8C21_032343, partial [Ambrosia artemisiifolia]